MIENARKAKALFATHSSLHPADFPVGSAQSRAAARMLSQQREAQQERVQVIISGDHRHGDSSVPYASAWSETSDGKLVRTLCVPEGMSIEEATRIVDHPC